VSQSRTGTSIRATSDDLPENVAAALANPPQPVIRTVDAAGIPFAVAEWGARRNPPLLLVHGVTSSSGTWWRIGPALAAAGYRVLAPDQAGHGRTGAWQGHHRFRDNASDLAALIQAAGIDRQDLSVVGHSWGAATVAWLPAAGIQPRRLVLVDPPTVPLEVMAMMVVDPVERRYADVDEARRTIAALNPGWDPRDIDVKAEGLTQFDEAAVRAVLLENGDWDGGLAGLADPAADAVETWVVRGDPSAGSLLPDPALPAWHRRLGSARVLTVADAPHSPHRTHPEATVVALLRALGVRPA
jgi:pimeloyl-ACP methyl ester carboxylesterase